VEPRVSRHGSGRLGSLGVRAPSHAAASGGVAGELGAGAPVSFAMPAAASRWGRETGERGKVGMRLTAGPTCKWLMWW
jgi:hypothetical protein